MVDSNGIITEIECELEFNDGDMYPAQVVLTEGGDLSVRFDEGEGPRTNLSETWPSLDGSDIQYRDVHIANPIVSSLHNGLLTEINTSSVTISHNEELRPGPDAEVVIEFDVLCFQPNMPPDNQIDRETKETLEELAEEKGRDIERLLQEKEYPYVEGDDFEIYGVPFTDTKERVSFIKSEGKRMRTGKIRVRQEKHGTLSHHLNSIEDEIQKILELSQLVQETTPQYVRAKVVSIDDTLIEDIDAHYEKLKSGGTANVGGRFSQYPTRALWGNFPEYVREAYENYTPRVRDDLHLQQVLGYYVDARDKDRPVEPKLLSTCSAIELFSLWHAREDDAGTDTGEKIQHTINKLNVETTDLAEEVVSNPEELDYPEYFWYRERNHAVHGDPEIPVHDLIVAQDAALVLLKRLIRNQLLGRENESFERFYEMHPRPFISHDN